MDLRFSPEDEAFRQEVRAFIKKEWDPKDFNNDLGVFGYDFDSAEYRAHSHRFAQKLIDKGWYTMHWPQEWGGQQASLTKQVVYSEELAYASAPAGTPGGNITGAIMFHGSDWLKQEFLPKMASGDINWAQGFSEPNAGTDLASLSTRAVEDGDDFVVTGQKIWSSGSHFANWYHVLVRTDPTAP
ncbi:MAG: acyl-CoA dehydrogenase family protein, partial [Chloroflexi bacterium]|nr:acyl-CoA dehydrogenase family protein [Chloroflexota bacterium]